MATNLTTRYLVKQFAGIAAATTTWDGVIDALITQVSEGVAAHCGRTFELQEWRVWLDGTGENRLLLPEYPITALYGACLDSDSAATITYAGGKWATVNITQTTMTLQSVDATGTTAASDITLTGTLTDCAALVGAVSGWTMTILSGFATSPAILIRNLEGGPALSPDYVELEIPGDLSGVRLASGAQQSIEMAGFGSNVAQAFGRAGMAAFTTGHSNVFVWYKAGYTLPEVLASSAAPTTAGNVPGDLVLAVNSIIKDVLDGSRNDATMKSEKFTNYSYTKQDGSQGGVAAAIEAKSAALAPHRSMYRA